MESLHCQTPRPIKNCCVELCGCVHIAQRKTITEIPIGRCTNLSVFMSISVLVSGSVNTERLRRYKLSIVRNVAKINRLLIQICQFAMSLSHSQSISANGPQVSRQTNLELVSLIASENPLSAAFWKIGARSPRKSAPTRLKLRPKYMHWPSTESSRPPTPWFRSASRVRRNWDTCSRHNKLFNLFLEDVDANAKCKQTLKEQTQTF